MTSAVVTEPQPGLVLSLFTTVGQLVNLRRVGFSLQPTCFKKLTRPIATHSAR